MNTDCLNNVLIAIPAYNEGKYLESVVGRVKKFSKNILIIDDGSTDNTPDLLKSLEDLSVIRHKVNTGYGRSLIDALEYANSNKYEWLITMDCDMQHEPETLPLFYEYIRKNQYDVISGSRYLNPLCHNNICPPNSRVCINKTISCLLKKTIGLELTDSFCGFKAYRISFMKKMNLTTNGYAFPLQVWVQTVRLAGRIIEIPVKMIYSDTFRSFGENLDDPDKRFYYYLETLNRELKQNGYKKIKGVENTFKNGCDSHIADDK